MAALPPTDFAIPYPERVLSAHVIAPSGTVELHNAHIPNGSNHGWIKIETFEGIHQRLARPALQPRILCGDFNSPMSELTDGRVLTAGERLVNGQVVLRRSRDDPDGRWARGEHLVSTDLAEHDMLDVFRGLHGYANPAYSFATVRQGKLFARRFDHIFASQSLNPVACQYLQLERRLSDHSPVEADFSP